LSCSQYAPRERNYLQNDRPDFMRAGPADPGTVSLRESGLQSIQEDGSGTHIRRGIMDRIAGVLSVPGRDGIESVISVFPVIQPELGNHESSR
jgi:hypothetical protein